MHFSVGLKVVQLNIHLKYPEWNVNSLQVGKTTKIFESPSSTQTSAKASGPVFYDM